jgi:ATP-dependent exoDNAse (exonuclease V) beta subunit
MYDEAQETFALKHAIDGRPTLRWYMLTNAHDGNGIVSSERGSTDYAEEFRLLYVALTRARDAVYVSGRRVHNRRRSQCADAVSSWLTGCGYDLEQHRLPPHPAADVTAAEANIDAVMIEEALAARLARIEMADRAHPQRLGALSYSAMELQERCPRRARYHYVLGLPDLTDEAPTLRDAGATSDLIEAPEPRDPARYGRIVHRVLEYDMQARLAGSDRDLAQFTADAVAEEEGTEEEESAALGAAKSASPLLERFSPVDVERRFTITIDGVTLGGYIDLLARDEKGRLVVVDYKTGRTPAEHYALQFALYAAAVTEEFGEVPRVLLLRIGDETATEEAPEPATEAALRAAIATANTMESDEPRPGTGCTFCPYAHDVCRAAPAALTSA